MSVFNQRFEALFPSAGALGCSVFFAPPTFLPVYLCTNVGSRGLLASAWPTPFPFHSTICQSALASHLLPSYRSGRMFLLYLLGCRISIQFDFLSVLVVSCFYNVVVLLLVVWGSTVCLPTPPSWFSQGSGILLRLF